MNDPTDPSNPLQGLLGDLFKLIGGARGAGAPWLEAARALAHGVATDGGLESNVDPLERIKLEELGRVAELHVSAAIGTPLGGVEHATTFVPVNRGTWAVRALEAWRPVLQRMVDTQARAEAAGTSTPADDPDIDGLEAFIGQFTSTMGPIMLGLQFGSAAGHLAQRALGQYALPLPWPASSELLVVPENVKGFATDWSLDEDAVRLFVCVRELAMHAMVSRPHVAARLAELLDEAAEQAAAVQQGLADRLRPDSAEPEALQHLLSDPEALLADLLAPGTRATSARLSAVASALGAYADHLTVTIARATTGNEATLSEAWYRYRVDDAKGYPAAGALFGLDLGREQVDRGAAFVRGVIERAGDDGLAQLLASAKTLPTPAEIDAPGLWLERISLPDPD
jgi:putative hydrolase